MDEHGNEVLSDILAKLGVPASFPAVDYEALAREVAERLGLDPTPEEARAYCSDFRRALEGAGCAACSLSLEECQAEPQGFTLRGRRTEGGGFSFSLSECPRSVQARELAHQRALLASSNIPASFFDKGLRSFKVGPGTAEAAAVASELAQDPARRGAVFYGPPGVGKTHLAAAILTNRLKRGGAGLYITVPDLMDEIRASFSVEGKTEKVRAAIRAAELLILDDLGAEKPTDHVLEELFKMVNARLLDGSQTVVTTNYSPADLAARFGGIEGERIVSRLRELCDWVELRGADFRGLAPAAASS